MKSRHLSQDMDYLIFALSNQFYALPYHNLVQIVDSPATTKMPNMDGHVRGAINFSGEMIVLYDLRKSLGIPALSEEVSHTVHSLTERKQDHIKWINTLKDEVYHDRDISVQTDPHKCAFGRWYDEYQPESPALADYMSRFDAPHKHIHRLAIKAQELIKTGQKQQARDMIHDAEQGELNALIALFNNAEQNIRTFTYEYAIVMENSRSKFAISVDAVKSFEQFGDIRRDIPPMLRRTCGDFLHGFGRKNINGKAEDVMILDVEKIITSSCEPLLHEN